MTMTQQIAPNNNIPATHFIEVWHTPTAKKFQNSNESDCKEMDEFDYEITRSYQSPLITTIAIFRIRENKLPTKHNFNK